MMLWSGRLLYAKRLARQLSLEVDAVLTNPNGFDFRDFTERHLTAQEIMECSFLFSLIDPLEGQGYRIKIKTCNCDHRDNDNFRVEGGGSGFGFSLGDIWLSETTENSDGIGGAENALTQATHVLSNLIANENFSDSFHLMRAGGWYEIFFPTRDGFIPLSYAVNASSGQKDVWELRTRISTLYSDGRLMVIRSSFDFLAELSLDPTHRPKGHEFAIFPVVELFLKDPSIIESKLGLHELYGGTANFALHIFLMSR